MPLIMISAVKVDTPRKIFAEQSAHSNADTTINGTVYQVYWIGVLKAVGALTDHRGFFRNVGR